MYDKNQQLVTKFNKNNNDKAFCTHNGNITTSLMVDRPISLDGQVLGRLVLYADPKLFWNNLISMSVFLVFIGILCYFLTWLLSKRYFKKETQSLLKLAATARRISKTGNYEMRVKTGDNPAKEISNLVSSFNDLLEIVENHSRQLEEMIVIRTSQLNEEKKKVEKISEAKSEFLAKLSHDIRTPLTAILGYTELINTNKAIREKHRNHIDAIIRNADFVSELVNGLLTLAKLESTDLVTKAEAFDINKILVLLKQTFQPLIESKNLKLDMNTLSLENNWLKGDSLKLHQVLNNLLENAVKYTQEGSIQFTISQTREDNDSVIIHIEITDSGIGISNEKINEIFDEYIQIGSDTSLGTGAGLGLAIARKLVNAMDGTINVKSNKSVGSTFSMEIPFKLASTQDTDSVSKDNNSSMIKYFLLQHSPILTIDDDPNCSEIVSEIILSLQPKVTIIRASSFKQAVELFKVQQPILVFSDIELPDGNGYELSEIFNNLNPNIIIVAISAYYDNSVTIIDTATNSPVGPNIPVEYQPAALGSFIGPDTIVDGAPSLNQAVDQGWFIWRENVTWKSRFFAAGTRLRFEGIIDSTEAMTNLTPISIEPDDVLVQSPANYVEFNSVVTGPYRDGFNIDVSDTARTCVKLTSTADIDVFIGPNKRKIIPPFDLSTIDDCLPVSVVETKGKPTIDRSQDNGVFIWETNNNTWRVEAVSGAFPRVAPVKIESDKQITNVIPLSIENSDVFTITSMVLDLNLNVSPPWMDGLKFTQQPNSNTCVTTGFNNIYIGPDRVAFGNNVNLDTLDTCF